MTVAEIESSAADRSIQPSGTFVGCSRCSLVVLRTELDIHLAHAHNIGPMPSKKDKARNGRGGRGRSNEA